MEAKADEHLQNRRCLSELRIEPLPAPTPTHLNLLVETKPLPVWGLTLPSSSVSRSVEHRFNPALIRDSE